MEFLLPAVVLLGLVWVVPELKRIVAALQRSNCLKEAELRNRGIRVSLNQSAIVDADLQISNESKSATSITAGEKDAWLCKEDLEHHVKFVGTGRFADGRNTPTPIEVFEMGSQLGAVPLDYLDRFSKDSVWYDEIQAYKRAHNI